MGVYLWPAWKHVSNVRVPKVVGHGRSDTSRTESLEVKGDIEMFCFYLFFAVFCCVSCCFVVLMEWFVFECYLKLNVKTSKCNCLFLLCLLHAVVFSFSRSTLQVFPGNASASDCVESLGRRNFRVFVFPWFTARVDSRPCDFVRNILGLVNTIFIVLSLLVSEQWKN